MQPNPSGGKPPHLTLVGIAKYMACPDAKRREDLLYYYKYPQPEGSAMGDYYTWAKKAIRSYHQEKNDIAVLDAEIQAMESKLLGTSQQAATKIENNRRVVLAYRSHFAQRKLTPLPDQSAEFDVEGVSVNLRPHLIANEGKRVRIIQFAYTRDGISPDEARFVKQLLLYYGRKAGFEVSNSDCLLYEIATGDTHTPSGVLSTFEPKLKSAMREARRTWAELTQK